MKYGCISRAAGEHPELHYLKEKEEEQLQRKQKQNTFAEFAKDFWSEDSPYVRGKRAWTTLLADIICRPSLITGLMRRPLDWLNRECLLRISSYSPIILIRTRFFLLPSNSP